MEGCHQEVTEKEVERILGYLKSYHQDDPMAPISYYEFVIDPNSFSRTVENIFHTSFLVRDGLAQVYLDDDKLPCIAPVEEGEEGEVGAGESSSQNQWIVYQPQNVEGAHSGLRHHRRNDSASKHRMSDGPRHVSLAETEQCF